MEGQVEGTEGAEAGRWEGAGAVLTPIPSRLLQREPLDLASYSDHPNSALTKEGCGCPPLYSGVLRVVQGAPRSEGGKAAHSHAAGQTPYSGSGCEGMRGMGQRSRGDFTEQLCTVKVRRKIRHLYLLGVIHVFTLPCPQSPPRGWGWQPLKLT